MLPDEEPKPKTKAIKEVDAIKKAYSPLPSTPSKRANNTEFAILKSKFNTFAPMVLLICLVIDIKLL
jgi:hypothetical protein